MEKENRKWLIFGCICLFIGMVFSILTAKVIIKKLNMPEERIEFSVEEFVYQDLVSEKVSFKRYDYSVNIKTTNEKESSFIQAFLDSLGVKYNLIALTNGLDVAPGREFEIYQSDVENYYKDDFVLKIEGHKDGSYVALHVFDACNIGKIYKAGSITVRYLSNSTVTSVYIKNDEAREKFKMILEEEDLNPENLPYDGEENIQYMPLSW